MTLRGENSGERSADTGAFCWRCQDAGCHSCGGGEAQVMAGLRCKVCYRELPEGERGYRTCGDCEVVLGSWKWSGLAEGEV